MGYSMTLRRSMLATALAAGLSATLLAGCGSSKPGVPPALSDISGGVQATDDVTASPVTLNADSHATTELTVKNSTDTAHDYTISVLFNDSSGSLQDLVVVNAPKVPAHGEARATAKSNRKLSGTLTAKVSAAVRH
jgi:hypothetical protein